MAGDIAVSDMTFEVTEHDPVTSWCYSGLGCGQTYLYGFLGVIGSSANLLVERVGFDGGPGRCLLVATITTVHSSWAFSRRPADRRDGLDQRHHGG